MAKKDKFQRLVRIAYQKNNGYYYVMTSKRGELTAIEADSISNNESIYTWVHTSVHLDLDLNELIQESVHYVKQGNVTLFDDETSQDWDEYWITHSCLMDSEYLDHHAPPNFAFLWVGDKLYHNSQSFMQHVVDTINHAWEPNAVDGTNRIKSFHVDPSGAKRL